MDWHPLVVVAHIVGAAIGVGGALATDSVFLRSIRNRRISSEQFLLIRSVSDVVLLGLGLVALTGVVLLLMNPGLLGEASFQAKMLIVLVLLINGLAFHLYVLPYLARHRDLWLEGEVLSRRQRWLFATSGALSGVSWFGALILGAWDPPEIGLPLKVAIYAAIAIGASVLAFLILSHVIFKPAPDPREEAETGTLGEGPAGIEWEAFLIGGITLVVVAAVALVGFGMIG
ncbi:MAG TPA: hypothetical protein VNW68_01670 [Candidatus Limnocylindria bacterium]|jgi:hypothetical protein|nr:hypothetical protein [Candidatus Limnocylindria bacterium]